MKKVTPEDAACWEEAMQTVKPLSSRSSKMPETSKERTVPRLEDDTHTTHPTEHFDRQGRYPTVHSETSLVFKANGVSDRMLKRLKQGQLGCDETLDLHGYTRQEAYDLLCQALQTCARVLHVIHGKSRDPDTPPALKNLVNHLLRQHPRVLGFCSAEPREGGTGAVRVLLRKKLS